MTLRALEFYSGIGGLHLAFSRAQSSHVHSIVGSFDWDQTAARVYAHNFPGTPAQRVDINTLSANALPEADVWLLSPACQPYTVLNPNAKGAEDPRAASFLHLIRNVLPNMHNGPRFLLVENVAGFETSSTRDTLYNTLVSLDYHVKELGLSPNQFGIANSRKRYYCLARRAPFEDEMILPAGEAPRPLVEYLDDSVDEAYSIPTKILEKWGRLYDIVKPRHTRSCCFTRGYTQLVERAGSILQINEDLDTTEVFDRFLAAQAAGEQNAVAILEPLRLRYFTPDELLRLFGFNPVSSASHANAPDTNKPIERTAIAAVGSEISAIQDKDGAVDISAKSRPSTSSEPTKEFNFPQDISRKSRYRLIGNSVNVVVVTKLLDYLLQCEI
ncbi:S-adenosyl-L-methionine-dependent methyltransferase [Cylindrobasidium torrendii FP15055 ss-10]|uniref:tRNA (cytosine(38)-C(5))-methyltransferase n=1 Tax=Cylindrobasidium torrendii FP15055 ss-10 TaxID=1314674 RepID=A0A0D7B580_9AGAR|nr:S-adenosyl-L-methionine-dependent methyltransferase [Cylindrobasidium torrendii FP15055 ss-10]